MKLIFKLLSLLVWETLILVLFWTGFAFVYGHVASTALKILISIAVAIVGGLPSYAFMEEKFGCDWCGSWFTRKASCGMQRVCLICGRHSIVSRERAWKVVHKIIQSR